MPLTVVHMAVYAFIDKSVENTSKYYHNSMIGTLTLLASMRNCVIDKIIFSIICATHDMLEHDPIAEDPPQNPIKNLLILKMFSSPISRYA